MATLLPIRPPAELSVNGLNISNADGSLKAADRSRSTSDTSNHEAATQQSPKRAAGLSQAPRSRSPSNVSSKPSQESESLDGNLLNRRTLVPQRMRPLKSQYPADSPENHVEYILVASFDIDRGPIMEHQYPGPISGDENMLAELMLPDQTHMRSQDWTTFFLHKDANADSDEEDGDKKKAKKRRKQANGTGHTANQSANGDHESDEEDDYEYDDTDEEAEKEEAEMSGPPLIYVLNLVNTKQDSSVRRGAVVKAMAVCTRHSFLHIYKPLLLLALEEYFKQPQIETLGTLFNAVNSMDLSLMPRLSLTESAIMQVMDAKDLFVEKFERMVQQRTAKEAAEEREEQLANPTIVSITGGRALRQKYALPRDTHEYESRVMYKSVPIPIKVPTAPTLETVGDFSLIKLIMTFSTPHTTSPQPFTPLHPHLTSYGASTHPIIVLLNAMLTQKRIIFIGHNLPSSEVAEAVLATCALASGGLLRGFTRHAFPYTDLTKINDLLKVPGFVAGVTNPAFANHPEWWDLLCDIPSGRIKISPKIESAPVTEGQEFFAQMNLANGSSGTTDQRSLMGVSVPGLGGSSNNQSGVQTGMGDQAFMDSVIESINSRHGEQAIRSKFRAYILKFTRLAAAFEEAVYGATAIYIGSNLQPPPSPLPDQGGESPRTLNAPFSPDGSQAPPPLDPLLSGHGYVWPDEASRNRELAANVARIEEWRNTRSYYAFVSDFAVHFERRPIKDLDLLYLHDRLKLLKLGPEQTSSIYLAISQRVNSYDEICQLLSMVCESNAGATGGAGNPGLFWIGLGLFHPRKDVREAIVRLLDRISEHEAGRHFYAGLDRFAKLALFRIRRDMEAAGRD